MSEENREMILPRRIAGFLNCDTKGSRRGSWLILDCENNVFVIEVDGTIVGDFLFHQCNKKVTRKLPTVAVITVELPTFF